MFPAIYRYMFNIADQSTDLYADNATASTLSSNPQNWTHELYTNLQIQEDQLQRIRKEKEKLVGKRS